MNIKLVWIYAWCEWNKGVNWQNPPFPYTHVDVRRDCLERTRRAAVDAGVPHLVDALDLDMTSPSFEAHPCWQVATVVYGYL